MSGHSYSTVYEYLYVGMFMLCNCEASRYLRFEEYGCCDIAILYCLGIRVSLLRLWDSFLGLACCCKPASRNRDTPELRGDFFGLLRFFPGYSRHFSLVGCFPLELSEPHHSLVISGFSMVKVFQSSS